jgi:transcription termination/antitermination protein NusG
VISAPAIPAAVDARWHVLQTLARQEKALARDLESMRVEHYLPVQPSVRYYGRRKLTTLLPVFPGYLFLRGTLDQAYAADRTQRVARIIPVPDQQRLDLELGQIRRALEMGATLVPVNRLAKGMLAEVRSGPLQGIVGEVEERSKLGRLILRIKTLGQAVSLDIESALLEPIAA